LDGVIVIDKPEGWTSHDVVAKMRGIARTKRIGHLGTLDPIATGVLPLVLEKATRLAQFYLSSEKTYEGVMRFGFATDTYDAEGEATSPAQEVTLALPQLRELASQFCGIVEQMPPPFSAKKIQGVPAYKLARKHAPVLLKAVQVEIMELEIVRVEGDRAEFRARVASGTYMRSVAHDMGQRMGCGAHLESLRRTAVGEFQIADSHGLEEIAQAARSGDVGELFLHPRKLLPQIPSVTANEEAAAHIRSGRSVNLPELSASRLVKVFYGQSELVAIATRIAGTLFHPKIVFAAEPVPQLANGAFVPR